jgi:UvrD-like helicase C-terminal domain
MAALRNWARAIAEGRRAIGGQSGRTIELIKSRLPPDSQFEGIGTAIALVSHLRTLIQAPRRLVLGVPAMYGRFRREAAREGRYFASGAATQDFLNRHRISPDEVDVLILVMLRNARQIIRAPGTERLELTTHHDWLENIKSRYLMQVFVDEATDLSAVQLACTLELANPRLRSWFACGDLRQRITANGIQDNAEMEWLNRTAGVNVDIRDIDIGYRQSRRLRELSDALASLLDPEAKAITNPPRGSEEADVWPLLGENLSESDLGQWLAIRIHEVEVAVGRLPSIAVFVDGDDRIDPLVKATQGMLAERSISIVGCKEGRVVGDAKEVRIFDIQHIKGMEFEAVFFVDVDRLAERIPDLFERYLYVGVTRAATYLGLTCQRILPRRVEPVRSKFRTDNWAEH